jgi:hypothetical protein
MVPLDMLRRDARRAALRRTTAPTAFMLLRQSNAGQARAIQIEKHSNFFFCFFSSSSTASLSSEILIKSDRSTASRLDMNHLIIVHSLSPLPLSADGSTPSRLDFLSQTSRHRHRASVREARRRLRHLRLVRAARHARPRLRRVQLRLAVGQVHHLRRAGHQRRLLLQRCVCDRIHTGGSRSLSLHTNHLSPRSQNVPYWRRIATAVPKSSTWAQPRSTSSTLKRNTASKHANSK